MGKRVAAICCLTVLGWFLVGAVAAQTSARAPLQLRSAYSNEDGSVQFLVLAIVQGEIPLTGQTLVADDGVGGRNAYTFPSEVADRRPGKFILIATQGFADLGLLRPDFVVPNGFLSPWGGRLRLDTVLLAVIGGSCDLDAPVSFPCGDFAAAVNNAGQWTILAGERAGSYGGLWWNAPAGSEPGWAVAVEQQGAIVMAVWFTHGTDGAPIWFVMPRGESALDGSGLPDPYTYAGTLYRMQGPPLGPGPFDASRVTAVEVGSATLSLPRLAAYRDLEFGVPPVGEFRYALQDGTTQTKTVTRQIFAQPLPNCVLGGDPGGDPNFQGLWWNAAEPGWGLYVAHQGDVVFAVWLAYDTSGRATWLTLTANRTGADTYAGTIRRTTGPPFDAAVFDPSLVTSADVGVGTLTFAGRDAGTFSYVADGIARTTGIARQVFAQPVTTCGSRATDTDVMP